MSEPLPYVRELDFSYGAVAQVSPLIRRVIAHNPSVFTFHGTGTYIVGHGKVAIIDAGPDLAQHVDAVLAAVRGETVTHLIVTHTHIDHSPATRHIKAATGAETYGFGPHGGGEGPAVEEGADRDFVPDHRLADGAVVAGDGWTLEAVHTPGHTSNHLCFALAEERALFSGDHVMGWSTTVVSPPDGDMGAYMVSLEKLKGRDEETYWPTHGPPIPEAAALRRQAAQPSAPAGVGDPVRRGGGCCDHSRNRDPALPGARPAPPPRRRPHRARPPDQSGRERACHLPRQAGRGGALPGDLSQRPVEF